MLQAWIACLMLGPFLCVAFWVYGIVRPAAYFFSEYSFGMSAEMVQMAYLNLVGMV